MIVGIGKSLYSWCAKHNPANYKYYFVIDLEFHADIRLLSSCISPWLRGDSTFTWTKFYLFLTPIFDTKNVVKYLECCFSVLFRAFQFSSRSSFELWFREIKSALISALFFYWKYFGSKGSSADLLSWFSSCSSVLFGNLSQGLQPTWSNAHLCSKSASWQWSTSQNNVP